MTGSSVELLTTVKLNIAEQTRVSTLSLLHSKCWTGQVKKVRHWCTLKEQNSVSRVGERKIQAWGDSWSGIQNRYTVYCIAIDV